MSLSSHVLEYSTDLVMSKLEKLFDPAANELRPGDFGPAAAMQNERQGNAVIAMIDQNTGVQSYFRVRKGPILNKIEELDIDGKVASLRGGIKSLYEQINQGAAVKLNEPSTCKKPISAKYIKSCLNTCEPSATDVAQSRIFKYIVLSAAVEIGKRIQQQSQK